MKPTLDRIDFRPDQYLVGADLAQASRRTADLLALHAARVHGVWGVADGYFCVASRRAVVVGPGVALDYCGRPVVNSAERVVPLPVVPVNGSAYVVDLVARWASTAELPESCSHQSMPAEQAHLRWELAGFAGTSPPSYSSRIRLGTDIPIARVMFHAGDASVQPVVDIRSRPMAHALTRPKIATGHVLQSTHPAEGFYADWRMTVSTASAGFEATTRPVYLVSLDAHPFGDTASLGGDPDAGPPPPLADRLQKWRGPYLSIQSSTATQFIMRVLSSTDGGWAQGAKMPKNPVPISWVGIDTSEPGPFTKWWSFLARADLVGGIT
jgi:hypothetical protein